MYKQSDYLHYGLYSTFNMFVTNTKCLMYNHVKPYQVKNCITNKFFALFHLDASNMIN